MHNASERLQILIGDTLQILDHMEVDSEHTELLTTIKNRLNELKGKTKAVTNDSGNQSLNSVASMSKSLSELTDMVIQLEANLMMDYQNSTGNQIDQYQQLSLEEQLEQTENYHNKIDYLSAVKIRENLNRMREVLLSIRS
ncbi:hypothetical protein GCM10008967_09590 [Bacillus carboniphilus]|uniref:DUF5082 domain-containing protein n=1 Tax=Bacillus carboniphilus TaxID=86663 RepID=A0ABN0VZB8_9BACI